MALPAPNGRTASSEMSGRNGPAAPLVIRDRQSSAKGTAMKVGEVMTRQVELASPDDALRKAAGRMAELDVGVLPVGEGDRIVGMLTDRDIAVRAVAQGKVSTAVRFSATGAA
jgi:CBS domain-containing protein